MQGRKKGETEAIIILENIGIEIDRGYYDDNSYKNMPDIRCINGRYIEVTHTLHNNSIPTIISKFDRLQPGEDWSGYTKRHLEVETECNHAYNRIRNVVKNQQVEDNFDVAKLLKAVQESPELKDALKKLLNE